MIKRRWFRPIVMLLSVIWLCHAARYVHPGTWRPHTQGELLTHTVYAYRQWQSTGLKLNAGDRFSIRARGEWLYSPIVGRHGPEGGLPAPPNYPFRYASGGALIGRIGDEGEPFYVGRRTTGNADTAGLLYLRINDDVLGDNEGQLALEIETVPAP